MIYKTDAIRHWLTQNHAHYYGHYILRLFPKKERRAYKSFSALAKLFKQIETCCDGADNKKFQPEYILEEPRLTAVDIVLSTLFLRDISILDCYEFLCASDFVKNEDLRRKTRFGEPVTARQILANAEYIHPEFVRIPYHKLDIEKIEALTHYIEENEELIQFSILCFGKDKLRHFHRHIHSHDDKIRNRWCKPLKNKEEIIPMYEAYKSGVPFDDIVA